MQYDGSVPHGNGCSDEDGWREPSGPQRTGAIGSRGDPVIKVPGDQYWDTRSSTELTDFDQWVGRVSVPVSQLQGSGYEVTTAQEKLTEITAMRSSLAHALWARNDASIEEPRETIHAASIDYETMVRNVKKTGSESEEVRTTIDQSEGVLTRSGMMNADLKSLGINCTQTQRLVETGHYQISMVQTQMKTGNAQGARATLSQFKDTLQSLRDAYREILIREDLPQTTAQGVLSVAQSLDVMSARMSAV